MSAKKLENYNTHEIVSEEAKILTTLLNDSVRQIAGEDTYNIIQNLIKVSDKKDYAELEKEISKLDNQEMMVISRYFATLPLLINISEDVELATEVNKFNNTNHDYLGKISDTIDLVSQKKDAQKILENVNVVPVLTAHPTQVQRKTMLDISKSSCKLI